MSFVQLDDIKVFYRVFRDGVEAVDINPTLQTMIVLHGGPGLLDNQVEVPAWVGFSEIIQTVFIDLRACGKTEDGILEKWSLKQCGEDLYNACGKLGIKKPIVAGVSAGGYIAMSYVIDYPFHPKALIFCNTEAKVSPEERTKSFLKFGSLAASKATATFHSDPTSIEKSQAFFEACVPYLSKKPFEMTPAAKTNWSVWSKFAAEMFTFDFREGLKRNIQCPVLILAGEDDPNHPIACAIETASYIPKKYVHFRPIEGGGAPVYLDQPIVFREQVTEFLQQLTST